MNSKSILACVFAACVLLNGVAGQSRINPQGTANKTQRSKTTEDVSEPVEVKNDRFSGVTTVKLKPQGLLDAPDHRLTMSLEVKLGEKKSFDWEKADETVQARFKSQSISSIDFGDQGLHFIVDGSPLNIGKTAGGIVPYPSSDDSLKPDFKISEQFLSVIPLSKLRQVVRGKKVEMRLGTIELIISDQVLKNLRAFVESASSQRK